MNKNLDFSLVENWIDKSCRAASGGNAQPWAVSYQIINRCIAFELSIDSIYKSNRSAMDIKGIASLMSLGCFSCYLIEVAAYDGFILSERVFVDADNYLDCSVRLLFTESEFAQSVWSESVLSSRTTDRYSYKKTILPESLKQKIQKVTEKYSDVQLHEVDRTQNWLFDNLAVLEKIRWIKKVFLKSMLDEISFTKNQENSKIPQNQLGVSWLDQKVLLFFSRYVESALVILKIGVYKLPIVKTMQLFKKNCAAFYFLASKTNDALSVFEFGLCFQALWLEFHSHGISFQPNGIGLVALAYWHQPEAYQFTDDEAKAIAQVTETLQKQASIDLKKLVIGFRVGYPTQQAKHSPRKKVIAKEQKNLFELLQRSDLWGHINS